MAGQPTMLEKSVTRHARLLRGAGQPMWWGAGGRRVCGVVVSTRHWQDFVSAPLLTKQDRQSNQHALPHREKLKSGEVKLKAEKKGGAFFTTSVGY